MDKEIEITIEDAAGKEFSFSNLKALRKFLVDESEFWQEQKSNCLQKAAKNSLHIFFDCNAILVPAAQEIASLNDQSSNRDDTSLDRQIHVIRRDYLGFLRHRWLWSKHPYVAAYVDCNMKYGEESAESFVDYIIKGEINISPKQRFLGTMLGYEFAHRDLHLDSRRRGEKQSLEKLCDLFQEEINKLREWVSVTRSEAEELHHLNKNMGRRQITNQATMFTKQIELWGKEVKNLEQLYGEKLHLEKPAEYWSEAAKKHGSRGVVALRFLFGLISIGLLALGYFFVCWLQGADTPVNLETWQGIVLFGSFMAVFAFSVRALSRLTFSSFHLMRDAEEREQLTYLYLSLLEEGASEKESRDIVLRSLFSRAQTGLLAHESGPHMLGEIVRTQKLG